MIKRLLKKLLWWLLFVLLFLLSLGVFLLATPLGTSTLFKLANIITDHAVSYQAVSGSLLRHLTVQQFAYKDRNIDLQVNYLHIDWQPIDLFMGKLQINAAIIRDMAINQFTSTDKPTKSSIHWPIPHQIAINNIQLSNISIANDGNNQFLMPKLFGSILLTHKIHIDLHAETPSPITTNIHLITSGDVEHYDWRLKLASVNVNSVFFGTGNHNGIQFNNAAINSHLSATGSVQWLPQLQWDVALKLQQANFTNLPKQLTNLSANITSKGNLHNFTLHISDLQGSYHRLPLSGFIALNIATSTAANNIATESAISHFIRLLTFNISSQLHLGGLTAVIEGGLRNNWQLRFKLNVTNLHKIIPAYQGNIAANGMLVGSTLTPTLQTSIAINNFKYLKLLEANTFTGKLALNIQITSQSNQPKLNGTMDFFSPRLILPEYNLILTQTQLHITGNNTIINYTGSSHSSGELRLNGKSIFNNAHMQSQLNLTGSNFLVSNTDQFKIFISPDLTLNNTDNAWQISGKVNIPRATITMANTENVVTLPKETRIIDSTTPQKTSEEPAANISSNVLITLGDAIYVSAKGATGRLVGEVQLQEGPNGLPIGRGLISMKDASYNLYGDKLTIDRGNFKFANSPIDNPSLDIRAYKSIYYSPNNQTFTQEQTIKAGVLVEGTVDSPVINFFSDPPGWSQTDILSLILLGQPASLASGGNLQILMRAAQALNSGNTSAIGSLQDNLKQSLGLDEFQFISGVDESGKTSQQSNAFRLGKALSPRLNLSYSLNILNSVNTFRLKYLLRKSWILQTESSSVGTGADVLYSIKK